MIDRVETESKSSDLERIRVLLASVEHLDVGPVTVGEGGVVVGPECRALVSNIKTVNISFLYVVLLNVKNAQSFMILCGYLLLHFLYLQIYIVHICMYNIILVFWPMKEQQY